MDVDRRSAGRCGLLRAEHPAKIHGFDLLCDLSDGKSRGERRRLVKPVLGSEKAKIWQEQALRASDGRRNSEKHAQPPPLGRGLAQGEPGRRFPAAGAGASWGRQAAPKTTSSRASGTRPQLRHGERARKPSSFWKSVHYNKSYGPETPIGSIQFTAIVPCLCAPATCFASLGLGFCPGRPPC